MKWGLVTDIQPPDLETRMAILRNKAERDHVQVPPETLEFIASKIPSNIRELEGALIRVTAYASLSGEPITTELAQRLLADLLGDSTVKPRTDEELLADAFGSHKVVATVEEHSLIGGFGSAVAEWLADRPHRPAAQLLRVGVGDWYLHEAGGQGYARERYGLTAENIAKRVQVAVLEPAISY